MGPSFETPLRQAQWPLRMSGGWRGDEWVGVARNPALEAPPTSHRRPPPMSRKYFGPDGIRGRTNEGAMTAEIAMRVGQAAGAYFMRGSHRHRVLIGKDTRLSGYMMES